MARIFISYRRDDSGGWAGRLFDRLGKEFGEKNVFMDIDNIDPGQNFVEAIQEAVGSCDVLIAVIGRQWLNITNAEAQRRLDDPEDFVRLEIATALQRRASYPSCGHSRPLLSSRSLSHDGEDELDGAASLEAQFVFMGIQSMG